MITGKPTDGDMKSLFMLDPDLVFLNHGSFGACPKPVFETYQQWQRELERNPVNFLARRSGELLAEAKGHLARYLGIASDDLVFLTNATSGVNIVARSLPLKKGDEILTTDHEYGACSNTWNYVCQHTGARYLQIPVPLPFRSEDFADLIWSGVTDRTRVIFLSHITANTALIFPVSELCRRARSAGILTLIDGAHAPGHIQLNLARLGADFYTGNCHKWLCAPKGSAFLYARSEHHTLLDAPVISWGYCPEETWRTGYEAFSGRTQLERKFQWQGTRDIAAMLSVPAAIEFQAKHNWELVSQDCHDLAVQTLHEICNITGFPPISRDDDFGQMVAIPVPPINLDKLEEDLLQLYKIEIPVTGYRNWLFVRLSVQAYNTVGNMDKLIEAIRYIYYGSK